MVNQKTNKCQKISNCTLLFICVFVYLIWMDVALYIKLQQLLPYSQRPKTRPKDGPFSPFEPITMKLLMNCPQEHYIHLPLAVWFEDAIHISNYVTPNMVSLFGLFLGLCSARLFLSLGYKWRLLGFVFYFVRDFMDALDGVVARKLANLNNKQIMNPESWGFAIDGICDGIADVAVIIATGFYLLKTMSHYNSDNYDRLVDIEQNSKDSNLNGESNSLWTRIKRLKIQWFMPVVIKVTIMCIVFGLCSGTWNYFMYNYSMLFDTDLIAQTEHQQWIQLMILKSPIMWLIIFMWRWMNAVTMMQFYMVGIVFEKTDEYLNFVKQHGALILASLAFATYLHYIYSLANISA